MPFIETALFDSAGVDSQGENVNHYGGIRLRVTGSGNLDMTMYSQDRTKSKAINPLILSTATNISPTRLTNFVQQRALLRIETDEINEYFIIQRIIIFAKPLYQSLPSQA